MTTRPEPGASPGSGPGAAREPRACVVVCEDDAVTLELLCDHLSADSFAAVSAASAADALRLCRCSQPDLLLLDLGLPDASGLELLREIRDGATPDGGIDPQLAVIILSGRGEEAERVRGLEAGADDYLVKPFSYAELRARIDVILRRATRRETGLLRVGDLLVDPARRRACVGGREIALSRKEFSLLALLASEPSRVFSKQELLAAVWGRGAEDRTRTLDSHASRLRRKLDPEARTYVINCWGIGYRLCESAALGASSAGAPA
jgi:DNA-binding response OmpR family regulator